MNYKAFILILIFLYSCTTGNNYKTQNEEIIPTSKNIGFTSFEYANFNSGHNNQSS